jgi:hypothetical protein
VSSRVFTWMDESEEGDALTRASGCNGLLRRYHSVSRQIRIETDCSMAKSREVTFSECGRAPNPSYRESRFSGPICTMVPA